MKTYSKKDIGITLNDATLFQHANDTQNGSFCVITGYMKSGDEKDSPLVKGSVEVSSFIFHFGINYGKAKAASRKMLDMWIMGKLPTINSFKITRNVWFDETKKEYTNKAKGRVYGEITKTYDWNDGIVQAAMHEVMAGLIAPTKTGAEFQKEAKSVGSLDGKLYLRDVFLVKKIVTQKGEYKQSAQGELAAIKNFVRSQLPVGNYRTFKLDDHITGTISFGGHKLMMENGVTLETLPELVKEYLPEATLAGQITPEDNIVVAVAIKDTNIAG